ncbi:MspA family porin [Mycolicibacterium sp. 120270]|uniref:MspA family porin n=1 Tax=Mycolicibacterium sp. 120270 TaxID=3090600 RepID=UPI00299ED680|nr:MspA family porin [Mycolicibacterium sp. 120270]MDX1884427.1 MspA family porin [Mycolicibacterium sp. 120270]
MLRCATLLATCAVAFAFIAPASADPEAEPVVDAADVVPAPPEGAPPPEGPADLVESSPPATTKSPDGWTLTVSAKDETQRVIQPLTTAVSTREYEVGGLFNAKMEGPEEADPPEGTFEVGYQIGCGIDMSTSNGVVMSGSLGFTPGLGIAGLGAGTPVGIPTFLTPISGSLAVALKPGIINVVPVSKKEFTGAEPWIQITGFRVKIDGCVGESFIRSYAFLTRSTDVSDAILGYYGVTKKV